jgi:hypothetical protein
VIELDLIVLRLRLTILATILEAGKLQHEHFVEAGDGREVERVEALHRPEPCRPDTPLDRAPLSIDQLKLDHPRPPPKKISGTVTLTAPALARPKDPAAFEQPGHCLPRSHGR